jgi:high affinity Mn2+ porin
VPNGTDLDFHFWRYYGDAIEIEHDHEIAGQPGAVRVLAYHNRENMGRFQDAVDAFVADGSKNAAECTGFHYSSTDSNAPDLCWARKPNDKYGIGINIQQAIAPDLGVFLRAMISDGDTEVYAFTPTDRSIALGALARGGRWCRRDDYAGVGFGAGGLSDSHARYLQAGGIDGFIGDGKLTPGTEAVAEAFYGANLSSSIWLSGDYEFIVHPAMNVDRGPVHIFGARFHAEF